MRLMRTHPVVRTMVVLGITTLALVLGAIMLPPKSSNAMPKDVPQPGSVAAPG
jgi:hypothetical protein